MISVVFLVNNPDYVPPEGYFTCASIMTCSVSCIVGICLQCYWCLSEFEESKNCLKRCLKISELLNIEKQEVSLIEQQLKAGEWVGRVGGVS